MFKVALARRGKLLEKAQRLRQKVFFGQNGKDSDVFDKFCRHLVVVEKKTGNVVGTYRLLLGRTAHKNKGFYSEGEFDLRNIRKNCKGEVLEMGRACVDSAYRSQPLIIRILWKELLRFFAKNKIRYVIGCASVNEHSPGNIGPMLKFFRRNCFAPKEFRVNPLKGKKYPYVNADGKISEREIIRLMPSLVRGYLKMGAYVCGEPVWDKDFDTADFFMLLDMEKINAGYKKRFQ